MAMALTLTEKRTLAGGLDLVATAAWLVCVSPLALAHGLWLAAVGMASVADAALSHRASRDRAAPLK